MSKRQKEVTIYERGGGRLYGRAGPSHNDATGVWAMASAKRSVTARVRIVGNIAVMRATRGRVELATSERSNQRRSPHVLFGVGV